MRTIEFPRISGRLATDTKTVSDSELVGSTLVEKYWPGFRLDNLNGAWCMYRPSFQFS